MSIKITIRPHESVNVALRRFKKVIERAGLMREVRRRSHYVKPSDERRITAARQKRAIAKAKVKPKKEYPYGS